MRVTEEFEWRIAAIRGLRVSGFIKIPVALSSTELVHG